MGISRLSLVCANGEGKGHPKPGHPLFFGAGPGWFGSGGRGSLRARRRLGSASPPPAPSPPVWGSGDGQRGAALSLHPFPGPAKAGKSRAQTPPGAMKPPLVLLGDPPLWGALESPLWDPPLPTDRSEDTPAQGNPTMGTHSWRGQWDNPPAAHRGLCWGCHPRPGLTKGFCHTFSETLSPKQTSHLFTGRQWP